MLIFQLLFRWSIRSYPLLLCYYYYETWMAYDHLSRWKLLRALAVMWCSYCVSLLFFRRSWECQTYAAKASRTPPQGRILQDVAAGQVVRVKHVLGHPWNFYVMAHWHVVCLSSGSKKIEGQSMDQWISSMRQQAEKCCENWESNLVACGEFLCAPCS